MGGMRRGLAALGVAWGILGGVAPAPAAPPAIDAWGHLPSVDEISVSPDGSRLAMMVANEQGRQIQIRRVADRKVEHVLPVGDNKIRTVIWGDADRLVIVNSRTDTAIGVTGPRREWSMGFVYDLSRRKLRPLLDAHENAMNVIAGIPVILTLGGRRVAYIKGISFVNGQGMLSLFAEDLANGSTRLVTQGNADTIDFLVDDAGRVVAREEYRDANGQWQLWTRAAGQANFVRSLSIHAPLDHPDLIGFDTDQQTLLIATGEPEDDAGKPGGTGDAPATPDRPGPVDPPGPAAGGDEGTVRRLTLGATAWSVPVRIAGRRLTDRATRLTAGYVQAGLDDLDYRFARPEDAALWARIRRAFPRDVVSLASWSDDRGIVVLQVEGEHGAAFFLLDTRTHHADFLADEYAEIGADRVAPVRTIRYKAADGLEIPAYLTLPRDLPAGARPPLVVLVHGGPAARDYPGFDWWSQALASRGYAVLQPQYRGSDGFGGRFLAAGYGQWGRKMQSDVSDGVRRLAADGAIDPARVCIMGGSYGGYAALAGITLESGVYRCAISLAGPSDMRRMLAWEKTFRSGRAGGVLRYWQRFTGAASPVDPALDAISPLRHADRATAPLLLIHGADDTVVPFDQSRTMADALAKAGHPATFVRLAAEDHWLSRSQTRIEMLRASETFLARYLDAPAKVAEAGAR